MKHTDFYDILQSVKRHTIKEIKAAVKAHGGEYSWEDGCPIVAANPEYSESGPVDVCINSIRIDEDGVLEIEGVDNEHGWEVRGLTIDDIFIEHLGYIIEYMDDSPNVSDVSIPFEL